jgi:hypothetical protein
MDVFNRFKTLKVVYKIKKLIRDPTSRIKSVNKKRSEFKILLFRFSFIIFYDEDCTITII